MGRILCGCAGPSGMEVGIGLLDLLKRIHDERPAGDDRLIDRIGVAQNGESGADRPDVQAISLSELNEIEPGHADPVHPEFTEVNRSKFLILSGQAQYRLSTFETFLALSS
jgi:hypothetical protein